MTAPAPILFFLPDLAAGGAERVTALFANRLDRTRFRPMFCLLRRRGVLLDEVAADVDILSLETDRARSAAPALVRVIRRVRPAVVLSSLAHCNLLLLALRPLLPGTVRLYVREANLPSLSLPWRLRTGVHLLYRTADAVLCPSLAIARELEQRMHMPAALLQHLANPVDLARLDRMRREPLPAGAGSPAPILAVGRLDPQKGFDILLKALTRTSLACDILGSGVETPHGRELQAMVRRLNLEGRVRLLGHQANPWAWMARAQCLVLPSRYEGLANAVIEAQALGLPVVASAVPGMEEVVEDGQTGLLVPPADAAALAHGLETALARDWDRAAIAALARERHDPDRLTRRLESLLLPHTALPPLDAGRATR